MKTKIFIALSIALCIMSQRSHAQIFYQDIVPDVVLNSWGVKNIHIDSMANCVLSYGGPGNLSIWQEGDVQIVVNAFSDCEVFMSGAYPAALNYNVLLTPTPWQQPNYAVLNNGTNGNWMGVTDKYLGVRIKNGVNYYYGWIRMDVNLAGNSVTIKDYACNRLANASINTGQLPTGMDDGKQSKGVAVSFYPNPFSISTILNASENMNDASLTIYNSTGNIIKTFYPISGKQFKIDRENLRSGLYYYELKQNLKNISTGKLIITD